VRSFEKIGSDRSPAVDALAVLAAAVLYTTALPPFDLWPAAFLVTAPLATIVLDQHRRVSLRRALTASLIFGEITTLAVGGPWLFYGANGFFGKSIAFSLAFTLATTLSHAGIFIGLGTVFMLPMRRLPPPARIIGAASMWVLWEQVRSTFLYGCPWNLLGHAFHSMPVFMQPAAVGGVPMVSWTAAAVGIAIGTAFVERGDRRTALQSVAAAVLLVVLALSFGTWRLSHRSGESAGIEVGIVQANVGRHELWDPANRSDLLADLLRLSRDNELAGVNLIVWAENAVPFALSDNPDAAARIQHLAEESGSAILVGAPRSVNASDGRARFYNSLYAFQPGQKQWKAYDKVTLLPYIEAMPTWAVSIGRKNGIEYSAGVGPQILSVGDERIAPLICFESTYPALSRRYRLLGANVIVNVSNDSWFDKGAAPEQHFAMTRFRAVESGLPIIRVANTGISAVVDGYGVAVGELAQNQAEVGRFEIPAKISPIPAFVVAGDLFAAIVCALAIMFWIWGTAATTRNRRMP